MVVFLTGFRQGLSAFSDIQNTRDFVHVKANDGMLVKLGQRDQRSRVAFNQAFRKQIFIKGAEGSVFALDAVFMVGHFAGSDFAVFKRFILDVERQITRVALQILLGDLLNVRGGKRHNGLSAKFGQLVRQILKKELEIVGIAKPSQNAGLLFDGHKVIGAEIRQFALKLAQTSRPGQLSLRVVIVGHKIASPRHKLRKTGVSRSLIIPSLRIEKRRPFESRHRFQPFRWLRICPVANSSQRLFHGLSACPFTLMIVT